jgi:hypothetical protein
MINCLAFADAVNEYAAGRIDDSQADRHCKLICISMNLI